MRFLYIFGITLIPYLLLTAGSGHVLLFWSAEELIVGVALSLIFGGIISSVIIPRNVLVDVINPFKWILATFYMIGPFFLSLLIANIEVMYRIISGRINPAIVRVETGLNSVTGVYFLANSITLSPGTLTIDMDVDNHDLYIHCLNWKKEEGQPAEPRDVALFSYFWMKLIYG